MSSSKAHVRLLLDEGDYREDFKTWVFENWPIWVMFERLALNVATRREHFSARTIIHKMRYDTALSDQDGEYKINNNYSPDMSRLFAAIHPEHAQLFERRGRSAAA